MVARLPVFVKYYLPLFIRLVFQAILSPLSSQAGFAPIIALFLIVAGIFGGTYLVQQRTNFLPQAAGKCSPVYENICANRGGCSIVDGAPRCGDETSAPQSTTIECASNGSAEVIDGEYHTCPQGSKCQDGQGCVQQPVQPTIKCKITYKGVYHEDTVNGQFVSACEAVPGYTRGRRSFFTCQSNGQYQIVGDDCDLPGTGQPNPNLSSACSSDATKILYGDGTSKVCVGSKCVYNGTASCMPTSSVCNSAGNGVIYSDGTTESCIGNGSGKCIYNAATNSAKCDSRQNMKDGNACDERSPEGTLQYYDANSGTCFVPKNDKQCNQVKGVDERGARYNPKAKWCERVCDTVSTTIDGKSYTIPNPIPNLYHTEEQATARISAEGKELVLKNVYIDTNFCGLFHSGYTSDSGKNTEPTLGRDGDATIPSSSNDGTTVRDADSCRLQKTCIYSQAKDGETKCYLGLCKSGNCAFNSPDCSYQNASEAKCLNTNYKHENSGYTAEGVPGTELPNCPSNPAQGGTTGTTSTGTPGDPVAPVFDPTEKMNEKELAEFARECGYSANEAGGIPFGKVGIGENLSVNNEGCKKLQEKQSTYFQQQLAAAARKLREEIEQQGYKVDKNKETGQYTVTGPDEAKAKELQKKLEENDKAGAKVAECSEKSGAEAAKCLEESQKGVQTAAEEAQKLAAKNALDKLKIILAGGEDAKGRCVKADLGLSPVLEAKRLKARGVDAANPKGRRTFHRLLICRGNDKNDLKWRVLVGGEAGAQFTGDDGTVDEGNDAERLYGLYGTDEKASGPPQFGAGFAINRCVTLTGSTSEPFVKKEDVEKNLAKYIAVAESGDIASLKGCKAEPNPDDEGGSGTERRAGTTPQSGTPSNPGGAQKPPEGGSQQPGGEGECKDTKECLQKNGDGWICNSDKKCENDGGNSCTNDDYCKNKYPEDDKYTCQNNVCSNLRMPGSPVFSPLESFFRNLF